MKFFDLSSGKKTVTCGISEFREVRPGERVQGPFKVWELTDSRGWVHDYHWKKPSSLLKPVGFYEIDDLIVTQPGGTIVSTHFGFNCATGLDTQRSIPEHQSYFSGSPKNKIIIEADVIAGDGVAFNVWGHWLVDYLPRYGVIKSALGERFSDLKILLPSYTPEWIYHTLIVTCGVKRENIITYNPDTDIVLCKKAILPSYCYTREFSFHSFVREFYNGITRPFTPTEKTRKILVSRGDFSHSNRQFVQRAAFEASAVQRGYEIIRPEELSLEEQVKVFSEAAIIIGEHGSGMHNALFAGKGTVVGCLGFWNAVQLHIGYLMEHHNVYLTKGCQWPTPDRNEFWIDCSDADLMSFLDKTEAIASEEAASA